MDGYTILAGFLLFFLFFIYITWFGFSVKVENQKDQSEKISINPYDQVPFHRKLIDKKNSKVGMFDLGNHILIIGLILIVIFVSLNVE
jgi:cbb3-type cytochrome oxidase subunit 3